uniref:Cell division protein ZipA n=1 Tax=Candidatus Kentrum sp. DK TaxID=2126562 RepID=A0A450RVI2_9GAMM|nr:MAG: cell division protein ZipA [Candidatus Kentron sp. DK]
MDNLRLILFISGILVIAAIYAWEVFRERRANMRPLGVFEEEEDSDVLFRRDDPDVRPGIGDRQPHRERWDQTSPDPREDAVLGELDVLDDIDGKDFHRGGATSGDSRNVAPQGTSTEENVPVDNAEPAGEAALDPLMGEEPIGAGAGKPLDEESGATKSSDWDLSIDADAISPPPAEKSRTERRSEKFRAQAVQEKKRFGRFSGEKGVTEDLVIALTIMARSGRRFMGSDIRQRLENAGMRFGDKQIFHYFGEGEEQAEEPLFSAADILEPGTFSLETIEDHTSRGLVFFMQLPGALDGLVAFEKMLAITQGIAKSLEGELCDGTRSTLTTQAANHLRERIEELKRKRLV